MSSCSFSYLPYSRPKRALRPGSSSLSACAREIAMFYPSLQANSVSHAVVAGVKFNQQIRERIGDRRCRTDDAEGSGGSHSCRIDGTCGVTSSSVASGCRLSSCEESIRTNVRLVHSAICLYLEQYVWIVYNIRLDSATISSAGRIVLCKRRLALVVDVLTTYKHTKRTS